MSRVVLCVSATKEETQRLTRGGPRRDFVELARATDAKIEYARASRRKGIVGRITGPHIRQAWRVAAGTQHGDIVFADGEHVGLPLLFFLALRRRKPSRVVMIGHLPGRWWKRLLFRAGTRLGTPGRLLVHSIEQARALEPVLGRRWTLSFVPYHVDPDFWAPLGGPAEGANPVVVAVGAEHRDYETLVRAAEGLPARVIIAAGSHWARAVPQIGRLPSNVLALTDLLTFGELRQLYDRAAVVVVPLRETRFQAGVTTILEAMSMAKPVVVTATAGQRECVRGPLVDASGEEHSEATVDRGPRDTDVAEPHGGASTGLYVRPGDGDGLRAALAALLRDSERAARLGQTGRVEAARWFNFDPYVARLAAAILNDDDSVHDGHGRKVVAS